MRLCVGVGHSANLFELFDPVFERCHQTQRGAVVGRQRLAVQLVGEKGLRMQCDFALDADIILAVWRVQANVFRKGSRTLRGRRLTVSRPFRRERDEKIAQAHATPVNNLAPTLNTLELRDHLYVRELPYIPHREQQPGNSRRHIFGHLHRLHLYTTTFCVPPVPTQLLPTPIPPHLRPPSPPHLPSLVHPTTPPP